MNLHEYQSKHLLQDYGLPVPKGVLVQDASEVLHALEQLGGHRWVFKAQVHAGGRMKAGGVKLISDKAEGEAFAKNLLGTRLVTYQTGEQGQPVNSIWIEEASEIEKELYLGAVLDRESASVVLMLSTEGGVEIEKVAEESPEKIIKITVNPLLGIMPYQCREAAYRLNLTAEQSKSLHNILYQMSKIFTENDLSLLEINPLIITKSGELRCLDAKINIDDNALYRQKSLRSQQDVSQDDPKEHAASMWDLNYIALDGNIGCMVNGAGLAMATMDLIKHHGGSPANFLDVGGGATQERVKEAFKIILSDEKVKGILVNIFGGIVRCDDIAHGVVQAVKDVGIDVPVVVRLQGNRSEEAAAVLNGSGLNIMGENDLTSAAKSIIQAVEEKK